jgi:hypothetical protein
MYVFMFNVTLIVASVLMYNIFLRETEKLNPFSYTDMTSIGFETIYSVVTPYMLLHCEVNKLFWIFLPTSYPNIFVTCFLSILGNIPMQVAH